MMHNNKCCTTSCTYFSPHSGTRCTRAPPRPPRRPAAPPTPRAQPLRTHIHTHNLPHNKHTRTCTFPPPRHVPRNTTARLRAVYRPAPCGYLLGPRSRDDCLPPAYNHRFGAHHYYCRYCRYCSLPQNQPARLERQRAHRSRPQTLARWPPRRPPRARLDAGPERECTSHRCSPALAAIPARRTLIPARLITVTKLALGHATVYLHHTHQHLTSQCHHPPRHPRGGVSGHGRPTTPRACHMSTGPQRL